MKKKPVVLPKRTNPEVTATAKNVERISIAICEKQIHEATRALAFWRQKLADRHPTHPNVPSKPIVLANPEGFRQQFVETFNLGDDQDDERAVRAAALLLEWASDDGMGTVNAHLALGIAKALYLSADRMAATQRRFTALKEKVGDVD